MNYSILKNKEISILLLKYLLFVFLFFSVDSAISFFLTTGLNKYYGLNTPSKVLLIGHSHTMLGLDKLRMEEALKCHVAKYAIEGANIQDRLTMIKHFLYQNGDSVRLITFDVDAFFITGEGLSENSYKLFYPFMADPYIDEYLREETSQNFEYQIKKRIKTSRFTDLNLNGSLRGHLGFYSNIKVGIIDTVVYKERISENDFLKITFDKDLQDQFEEMLDLVTNRNIKLVLLQIPTIGILNRAEPEKYSRAIQMLENYAMLHKNVYYINYNIEFENNYELFYDPVHLNPRGNKLITERLIHDINQLSLL